MRNQAYEQWKRKMLLAAKEKKVPISVHFELTPRCNLDCKMCYIHNSESNSLRNQELSTDEWKRIFDQAYDYGMLFATLSGGECLLRTDFEELYLHLWKKRIMITVMTNGTLLTEKYQKFFKKYPPVDAQISLYGSNEENYLCVTGHCGFERAMEAIRSLIDIKIPVHVAVTPSKYMKDDFINIRRLCKENKFWCNQSQFYLSDKRDGTAKDDYNLSADEIFDLSKEQALLKGYLSPVECTPEPCGSGKNAPRGLVCSGGSCVAVVSWNGIMHPCTLLPIGKASVLEMSYAEAWEKTKEAAGEILLGRECVGCPYDSLCPKCPAMRLTGLYTGHCNPAVCELTRRLVAAGVKKLDTPAENNCND